MSTRENIRLIARAPFTLSLVEDEKSFNYLRAWSYSLVCNEY